jgi:methionine synthase I (cobalamin-dependent)
MAVKITDLLGKKVLLFDGAMGTQLIERGMKDGECPEKWCLDRPGDIAAIHRAYLNAGADVVITNTFGGNLHKLQKYGLEHDLASINAQAVGLARQFCPPDRYVAGDIGPSGLFLKPVGTATEGDFYEAFLPQARALADAGADLLIIETQYDLREALEALKAARTTGLPVAVTMTFDRKKRGFFTIMGDGVEKTVKTLAEQGADIVGANCTLDSSGYVELTAELKRHSPIPILVQPNAGQPRMEGDRAHYQDTPQAFAENIKRIIEAGADAVGSCCGSTPAFTAQIAELIKTLA